MIIRTLAFNQCVIAGCRILAVLALCALLLMALALSSQAQLPNAQAAWVYPTTTIIGNWSISEVGEELQIGYGAGASKPQYAVLHRKDSYLRLNCGPDYGWGTSIITMPCYWDSSGNYFQGAWVSVSWSGDGDNLLLTFTGTIAALEVDGEIELSPPASNEIHADVRITDVRGNPALATDRPGEAFKAVMLSSMHINKDYFDARNAFAGATSYPLPDCPPGGWIIPPEPSAIETPFGLIGGYSQWQAENSEGPVPSIEITLDRPLQISGRVDGSAPSPTQDGTGLWAASPAVLRSWSYHVRAYNDPEPPVNVSLVSPGTPLSGPVTLAAKYSDNNGVPDIRKAYLLINDSLAQVNAAMMMYDRTTNRLYLKNDANTSWGTGCAPGTDIVLQNSQCYLYVKDTTASGSGNKLTVNWRIALKNPFTAKNLNGYMYVQDVGGLTAGWDLMGLYYNVKPQVVSIDPSSGPLPIDSKTTLTSVYRDPNGFGDLRKCYLLVNDSLAQSNAILLLYDKASNKLYLKNDANTSWGTGYAPGTDVTLSNNQCEVYVKDIQRVPAGNDLSVVWPFKLKPSMTGKNLYSWMYVTDSKAAYDGWKKVGTHFTPTAPICVSVTPSSGNVQTGVPLVFTTEFSDDNGYSDINICYLQMSVTSSAVNGVFLLYDAKQNKVFLRNDANTSWGLGQTPGADVTLHNNQCIVYVKDTEVTPSGSDNLIIDWKITLAPSQVGKKLCERIFVRDNENLNSAWKVKGYVRAQ